MTAKNWLKGMVAGFIATVVLSVLMLIKQRMGLVPQLNPIEMLAKMAGGSMPAVGWVPHFLIGTVVWGSLFPISRRQSLAERHPVRNWRVDFDDGPCNANGRSRSFRHAALGIMVPIATLVLHLIYGAVLGGTYGLEHPDPLPQFQVTHR